MIKIKYKTEHNSFIHHQSSETSDKLTNQACVKMKFTLFAIIAAFCVVACCADTDTGTWTDGKFNSAIAFKFCQ